MSNPPISQRIVRIPLKWMPLLFPLMLFASITMLLLLAPDMIHSGPGQTYIPYLPYVLYGLSFLLGWIFTQTRISMISIILAAVTFMTNFYISDQTDPTRNNTVIFLATIYIPFIMLIFYHIHEQGIFTTYGFIRIVIILSIIGVIYGLSLVNGLGQHVESSKILWVQPFDQWLNIPNTGVISFGIAFLLLCIPRKHESPLLGYSLAIALVFVFAGLNFRSNLWPQNLYHIVLFSFMSGAALTLIWCILESSWRNANIDELTELPGRRSMKQHFNCLHKIYTIALLDIDHFKRINDKYGHDTGDQVLKFIAKHLRQNRAGKAYRFGGEEFVIISEIRDSQATDDYLEELRQSIASASFGLRSKNRPRRKPKTTRTKRANKKVLKITASIGIARPDKNYTTPQLVLEAADKALYKAKADGRNRIKIFN